MKWIKIVSIGLLMFLAGFLGGFRPEQVQSIALSCAVGIVAPGVCRAPCLGVLLAACYKLCADPVVIRNIFTGIAEERPAIHPFPGTVLQLGACSWGGRNNGWHTERRPIV